MQGSSVDGLQDIIYHMGDIEGVHFVHSCPVFGLIHINSDKNYHFAFLGLPIQDFFHHFL